MLPTRARATAPAGCCQSGGHPPISRTCNTVPHHVPPFELEAVPKVGRLSRRAVRRRPCARARRPSRTRLRTSDTSMSRSYRIAAITPFAGPGPQPLDLAPPRPEVTASTSSVAAQRRGRARDRAGRGRELHGEPELVDCAGGGVVDRFDHRAVQPPGIPEHLTDVTPRSAGHPGPGQRGDPVGAGSPTEGSSERGQQFGRSAGRGPRWL